ncbi:unnamed protein product [Didymodactylos carnosus]|uniref:Uncharacterized protein n=1 Tax=Didymodactylos carnosus TaxID=1234261 RepID=A0A815BGH6_9BILA|nr:unnamed protein product [Didymodactylos carnosus]CAF1269689.1 unnamed protein product [Didymodactylos carnosus]CAF3794064.1 unnamed protein product [Didymodactylos carnosus]CAF4056499.1 unnamed protein product [Didymodactylos carnosus]
MVLCSLYYEDFRSQYISVFTNCVICNEPIARHEHDPSSRKSDDIVTSPLSSASSTVTTPIRTDKHPINNTVYSATALSCKSSSSSVNFNSADDVLVCPDSLSPITLISLSPNIKDFVNCKARLNYTEAVHLFKRKTRAEKASSSSDRSRKIYVAITCVLPSYTAEVEQALREASLQTSANGRNWYLTKALEIQGLVDVRPAPKQSAQSILGSPLDNSSMLLPLNLDYKKAHEVNQLVLFHFNDTNEKFSIHIRNAIVDVQYKWPRNFQSNNANDMIVEVNKEQTWKQVITRVKSLNLAHSKLKTKLKPFKGRNNN